MVLSIYCCFAIVSCSQREEKSLDTTTLKPFGMSGKAVYILEGGVEAELFSYEGKGVINHMWFGGNSQGWDDDFGDLQIRIFADGEEIPSIDMHLFLGHGIGFLDPHAP